MYNHEIKIAFGEGGEVEAEPNPFPGDGGTLRPGDTVTWILPENRAVEVQFAKAQDLPVESNDIEESDQKGPFKRLLPENGQIVGELLDDLPEDSKTRRFYYKLVEDGRDLRWAPSKLPPGVPPGHIVGGGIDFPKKPPKGGNG
jgi:hypothetical protein